MTRERVLNQYAASDDLIALAESLIDIPISNITTALKTLYGRLDIDGSHGIQLDNIGAIVGMPRPDSASELYEPEDPDTTFTFKSIGEPDDPNKGFSELGRDDVGGAFASASPVGQMSDALYRVLLKAAIFRNNSGSTLPEIEQYSLLVLGVAANLIPTLGAIDVQFQRPLSTQERKIIRGTLRAAAGIRIRYLTFSTGEKPFGFAGAENSGFGSTTAQQVGSGFVRLF